MTFPNSVMSFKEGLKSHITIIYTVLFMIVMTTTVVFLAFLEPTVQPGVGVKMKLKAFFNYINKLCFSYLPLALLAILCIVPILSFFNSCVDQILSFEPERFKAEQDNIMILSQDCTRRS